MPHKGGGNVQQPVAERLRLVLLSSPLRSPSPMWTRLPSFQIGQSYTRELHFLRLVSDVAEHSANELVTDKGD